LPLPTKLTLEVVTPARFLLREDVDDVVAPGEEGYFGVRPGHTPFLTPLGAGEITYRRGAESSRLTCFWGFAEVLPDRVNILAEIGELAEKIDVARAEAAKARAEAALKAVREEPGYSEATRDLVKALTRLAVAHRHHGR
jgi:F-type H+-transporting ATPase subunit epsilon